MSTPSGLKQIALDIFKDALLAADPVEAVHRYFRVKGGLLQIGDIDYFLNQFRRIWVMGAGKASARMGKAIEEALGDRIAGGLVIVKYGCGEKLKRINVLEAGHPIPDRAGLIATEELLSLAKKIDKDDLVINLISGGGSALLAAPLEGIELEDCQTLTELMLRAGMRIDQVNAIRKRLSKVTGGRLAQAVYPATIISLILSDVISDKLDVIASGPTVPDTTRLSHSMELLESYKIWDQTPPRIREFLKNSQDEAPKADDAAFKRVQNLIIGSNLISLEAARHCAQKLGLSPALLTSSVQGEARELGKIYGSFFREMLKSGNPLKPPACMIAGGEPTVTIKGTGRGGRCQELALAVAMEIQGLEGAFFLAAGTDGTDGPTDAAGAVCDWTTVSRAKAQDMDPEAFLLVNNSYNFFSSLGDLVKTGPTGTNVMDIHLLIVG
jgi:glycerate 2-kinase